MLQLEIINHSDIPIYLPLDMSSISSYEYYGNNKKIIAETNSIYQLLLGIRVLNKENKLLENYGGSFLRPENTEKDMFLMEMKEKVSNCFSETVNYEFKKLGIDESEEWKYNFYYFIKNLVLIDGNSKICLQYVFNLSDFETIISPNYGESSIIKERFVNIGEGSKFYLELSLEDSFIASYINNFYKLFGDKYKIWDKKLISNAVKIITPPLVHSR